MGVRRGKSKVKEERISGQRWKDFRVKGNYLSDESHKVEAL